MKNQQAGFFILIVGVVICLAAIAVLIWDKLRKYKYTESVMGTVISHKRCRMDTGHGSVSYPCAVVEYGVDGRKYQCIQKYATVYYNSMKRAEYDWEIDEKYCLHCYVTSRCRNHVDPVRDWFPVGSAMEVRYVPGKPRKAYCGALQSMRLIFLIMGPFGAALCLFGALLMTVLA